MSEHVLEFVTASPDETIAVGSAIASVLRDGDVVLLHGDLGAGKTTLAKGIAAGLGVDGVVSSPSFALVNEYETGPESAVSRLYHLDLYRLLEQDDLASIGFADLSAPSDGVTVVEWPERAAGLLPDRYLLVEIETVGTDSRRLRISAFQPDGELGRRIQGLRSRIAELVNT